METTENNKVIQSVVNETTQQEDGFTKVVKKKNNNIVVAECSLDKFKRVITDKVISYYDRRGKECEFENWGISKRLIEEVKDRDGKVVKDENGNVKKRFIVYMKTYLSLVGDIVILTWSDNEVSYYTNLNHPELKNWGGKMYWKSD